MDPKRALDHHTQFELVENSEECLALKENGVEGSWFPMHLHRVRLPLETISSILQNTTITNEKHLASNAKPTPQEFIEIQLVNIHLRPPLNDNGSATLWTAYLTNKYRLNEVQYLISHFEKEKILIPIHSIRRQHDNIIFKKPNIPIIMLGDYNEHDHDSALTFLTKECLYKHEEGTQTLVPLFRDALNEFVPQT